MRRALSGGRSTSLAEALAVHPAPCTKNLSTGAARESAYSWPSTALSTRTASQSGDTAPQAHTRRQPRFLGREVMLKVGLHPTRPFSIQALGG